MPTATHAIEPAPLHPPAHPAAHKLFDSRTLFLLGLLIAGSGIVSPPVALVGGIAFGFTVDHPLRAESARLSKLLLQASVIALGFGMNIQQVAHAGRSGFAYTAISITTAMILGLLLGKLLHIGGKASFLITAGTAICGGSAIAAIAPITNANEEEISVSMGTVFLLNSVALLLFPPIGHLLHLTQNQFGLWAALAIHDTSSVVGAAAAYGTQALAIGTTVKLARALWIVPVSRLHGPPRSLPRPPHHTPSPQSNLPLVHPLLLCGRRLRDLSPQPPSHLRRAQSPRQSRTHRNPLSHRHQPIQEDPPPSRSPPSSAGNRPLDHRRHSLPGRHLLPPHRDLALTKSPRQRSFVISTEAGWLHHPAQWRDPCIPRLHEPVIELSPAQ